MGVTGHRWNRIESDHAPALRELLEEVFTCLSSLFAGPEPVLATGMAEGADLLAVEALPKHWKLLALLPLPAGSWRNHLELHATGNIPSTLASLDKAMKRYETQHIEIPTQRSGAPDYVALATALTNASDLLIAVWNGEDGLPGGTGHAVSMARRKDIPVLQVWHPGNGKWFLRYLGKE